MEYTVSQPERDTDKTKLGKKQSDKDNRHNRHHS